MVRFNQYVVMNRAANVVKEMGEFNSVREN